VPPSAEPPPAGRPHRDVGAFDERAAGYEAGWRGQLHQQIADRTAATALACQPRPSAVLDVGCGTGYLLRCLAGQVADPGARFAGVDLAPRMTAVAESLSHDPRLRYLRAAAERLPAADGAFDLVVSTTSFDHWADQQAGLRECARVLAPGGHLVLTDLFSALLRPTLRGDRRAKARTRPRAAALLAGAGLAEVRWHPGYALIIATVTAVKR
jgi:ubiquinone/menaquinone biosynthesis C-methylase UbiE